MLTSSNKLCCCVCNSADLSTEYKKVDDYMLLRCGFCGLVYLDRVYVQPENFLDDSSIKNSTLEYWGLPEYFVKHESVFNFFFKERLAKIGPKKGNWLDVGAGYGLWQKYLKNHNIFCEGIEIEEKAQKYCVTNGLPTARESIEALEFTKKYCVITMCDVLEHVNDPLAVLKKCHSGLEADGLLYLQVPDVLGWRYPYGDHLGLPHHLWQFNFKTLSQLCARAGFEVSGHWSGIQGVVGHYERGGPSLLTKFLWKLARLFKRGNRLQILLKKSK